MGFMRGESNSRKKNQNYLKRLRLKITIMLSAYSVLQTTKKRLCSLTCKMLRHGVIGVLTALSSCILFSNIIPNKTIKFREKRNINSLFINNLITTHWNLRKYVFIIFKLLDFVMLASNIWDFCCFFGIFVRKL